MAQITTRSNPTDVKEIFKKDVQIDALDSNPNDFIIRKLELHSYGLPTDAPVACIAMSGSALRRFELGNVGGRLENSISLDGFQRTKPLHFRFLIRDADTKRLLASIEGVRANDGAESDSMIGLEPIDLGQLLWEVDEARDQFILKYNRNVFKSASLLGSYTPFTSLVLPAALKDILIRLHAEQDRLEDQSDFFNDWLSWLKVNDGLPVPGLDADEKDMEGWCQGLIDSFCAKHRFADLLSQELSEDNNDE